MTAEKPPLCGSDPASEFPNIGLGCTKLPGNMSDQVDTAGMNVKQNSAWTYQQYIR